jgi:hypothetical protein
MALDDSGLLRIWSAKTLQLEGEVEVRGEHQFGARMLHPHTYLNKVKRRTPILPFQYDNGVPIPILEVHAGLVAHPITPPSSVDAPPT